MDLQHCKIKKSWFFFEKVHKVVTLKKLIINNNKLDLINLIIVSWSTQLNLHSTNIFILNMQFSSQWS